MIKDIHKIILCSRINDQYSKNIWKEIILSIYYAIIEKNKTLNLDKKVYIPKRPGEPDRSKADIKKAKKLLKWKPKISVKDGVRELISNIDKWKNAPVWNKKSISKATKVWFKYLK